MNINIKRRFTFDAAHRIYGHESKCNHLHGHRYEVDIVFTGPQLDKLGRLIDFGHVKQIIGTWIDETLDHRAILQYNDPIFDFWRKQNAPWTAELGKPPYILSHPPTAENIAMLIADRANQLLSSYETVTAAAVTVYETEKCSATYFYDKKDFSDETGVIGSEYPTNLETSNREQQSPN